MGCAQSSEVESLRAQVADSKASLKSAEAKGISLSHQLDALNKQHDALLAATHSSVSADTIADVNLDSDELDSVQKSKLQQFFGIADSEVSYFHKYRKLIKIYGPDVVMSLTSIASATVSKSVEAIVKKRASVVGGGSLPLGVPETSASAEEEDDDNAHGLASSSAIGGRQARISVDSKLHRFYGMDEESKRLFERQQDAVLRILRRLGEAPDLHELDEWMDEARKLKAAQAGQSSSILAP